MEHNSSFDSFELQITPVAQGFLKEIAKWAAFLSIVGFIFIGFLVLGALAMFAMGSAMSSNMQGMGGSMGMMGMLGGATLGVLYLIIALLYFFPVMYLFKFSSNAKKALSSNNTEQLTTSIENLKSHYKFMGILTIIGIAFYFIIFIVAIVAGVGAAAGSM
jgi:hypothetical protein